ncbi:hypothetical protein HYALB_00006192 [Hymenoscyphus albidus]|uniref:Calcineurin-like phosphoesterase domain-containing protein n=1 Tax=Hymenoscyphus albidus TaxID=595503 RepID=A0A9N9LFM9_9HELO|nr:hypothetical protein HYALB_00006192 [Hymenoscyphus albidus]
MDCGPNPFRTPCYSSTATLSAALDLSDELQTKYSFLLSASKPLPFCKPSHSNAGFYMYFASVLRNALFALVPVSFLLTTYLYYYPFFHLCAFPAPDPHGPSAYKNTVRKHNPFAKHDPEAIAPFRLLALGDPQLEGIPPYHDPDAPYFPNLNKFWRDALLLDGTRHNPLQRLRHSLHDLVDFYLEDIPDFLEFYRKRLDHIGNDYYLGHIYKTLDWWAEPTHVTVLGDLVGSQWIEDPEFESRGWRYWNRVMRGGERIPDEMTAQPSEHFQDYRILGGDAEVWRKTVLNVAGNHDIGYAGDLSRERMERFDRVFGKPNYELRFRMPINNNRDAVDEAGAEDAEETHPVPELRIVVLNSMNLDTPANIVELQEETYAYLNEVITHSEDVSRPAHFTILLTHIPMYKKEGICVDGPFFDFFQGDFGGGVKEQNHLSAPASSGFLEGIFGMSGNVDVPGYGLGRGGLILTGHDHEGCDTYHYINQTAPPEREWEAVTWKDAMNSKLYDEPMMPGLREITVRSMMGSFAGNAGLLSLWFDEESWDWKYEFVNCGLGTQHIWWLVHILDLVTIGVGIVYAVVTLVQMYRPVERPAPLMTQINTGRRRLTISGTMTPNGVTSPFSPLSAGPRERYAGRLQRSATIDTSGQMFVPQNGFGFGPKRASLRRKRSKSALPLVTEGMVTESPTVMSPGTEPFPSL